MTLPEVLLWQELRKRPDGLKFRRQHPAGPYILDFFCAKLALAVEVDGIVHDCLEVAERDEVRDAWLSDNGVTVLRICARDILNDINSIIESITAQACDP